MTMRAILLTPLLFLAACDNKSPEEQAREDARDIAMVEAAQKVQPPVQRLGPQPILQADIDKYNLTGPGCGFVPDNSATADPIMLAGSVRGFFKIGDDLVVLAADSGSGELPHGAHEKYSGRGHWVQLTHGPGKDAKAPASLTVRDKFERVVYFTTGRLICHP